MCLCAWECIFIYEQFWINNSNPALWSLTWKAFKIPRWFCLTLLVTKSLLWATWNTSWLKHCKFKKKSSPRTFFHCFCWAWGTAEERKRERETEREREKHPTIASHMRPNRALNLQPRYEPWPGIEQCTTFQFMERCSNQLSQTGQD